MTPSEFKAYLPEFSAETDQRVQTFIDNAAPFFDICRWGDNYFEGVANFVAHKIAVANSRGGTGAGGKLDNTSILKVVGDLRVGKSEAALLSKQKNPYMATGYGQEYWRLMRVVGAGASAV